MAALIINMCTGICSLMVVNKASVRGFKVLNYAIWIPLLVDVCLTLGGHTRFVGETFESVMSPAVTNLLGSSPWPWIHPSLSHTVHAMIPIHILRVAIQQLEKKQAHQTSRVVDVEGQRPTVLD
jgi:hypothetical protein